MPIRLRSTSAFLLVIGVLAVGFGKVVSADLQLPAARIIAAQNASFEQFVRTGRQPAAAHAEPASLHDAVARTRAR